MRTRATMSIAAAIGLTALGLAGCTTTVDDPPGATELVLVTHDSFALADGVLDAFTDETGIRVVVQPSGDAGELVNRLILTKDSPLGDVVFGIDNTLASKAVDAGVLEPYVSDARDVSAYLLPSGSGGEYLTPVDTGDVCVNVDHVWFAEHGLAEPETFADLADPTWRDLLVVEDAGTSSPGLAFLLATIAEYGADGWEDYWRALVDNGVEVRSGWTDAYYTAFSGPSSEGDRPLVVSYFSSPAAELGDAAADPPTGVLADTCFRQVEYAGIIAGTEHPAEAALLVDFLLSDTVQADVPNSMYVYPVVDSIALPDTWEALGRPLEQPLALDPDEIAANRDTWVEAWSRIAVP